MGTHMSSQQELSDEYQHDRVQMILVFFLHSCELDESSLSIRRVNIHVCVCICVLVEEWGVLKTSLGGNDCTHDLWNLSAGRNTYTCESLLCEHKCVLKMFII